MVKQVLSVCLSVGSVGISLLTLGTIVSIIAGFLSIVFTSLKIYDWVGKRKQEKK